jgi:hypothetical protein
MAYIAYVQRLIGRLYALWYCYIPTCRFTAQTFFADVHGRQDTFVFLDCVCRFESERLVVRPVTTVAYRLQPVRIVSLTY